MSILNGRIGSLTREAEAYKIALDAEIRKQGNIDKAVVVSSVNGLSNESSVNGLSGLQARIFTAASTATETDDVTQKSVQINKIIEESGANGVTSGEIIQLLKDRGIDFDTAYVYSFLSRAKSKGKLEYQDNKYFSK